MDGSTFDGWLWLVLCLAVFILVQRKLHRELQGALLLITRRPALTIGIFSLLFLPGVLLHELSHFLAARLLGVRTGRFSILPQVLPNGALRMGFVETEVTDPVRDALIGLAPLICGGLLVAWLGIDRLNLLPVAGLAFAGEWGTMWAALVQAPAQPDFWLWFYLAFTVSSTMLPSASDRRQWLPIGLALIILIAIAAIAGAGEWLLVNLAPGVNQFLRSLAGVFGFSLGVHILLAVPVWGLRLLISRLTGLQVV